MFFLRDATSLSTLNVSIASLYCSSQGFTGTGASGFHDTSPQSNMKCDVYVSKELYAHVVLSTAFAATRLCTLVSPSLLCAVLSACWSS